MQLLYYREWPPSTSACRLSEVPTNTYARYELSYLRNKYKKELLKSMFESFYFVLGFVVLNLGEIQGKVCEDSRDENSL
jgi:hypothetical protein